MCFDSHCPALSQPFTKRVLLDQHIQLMHADQAQEGKNVKCDRAEALPDITKVLWPIFKLADLSQGASSDS